MTPNQRPTLLLACLAKFEYIYFQPYSFATGERCVLYLCIVTGRRTFPRIMGREDSTTTLNIELCVSTTVLYNALSTKIAGVKRIV